MVCGWMTHRFFGEADFGGGWSVLIRFSFYIEAFGGRRGGEGNSQERLTGRCWRLAKTRRRVAPTDGETRRERRGKRKARHSKRESASRTKPHTPKKTAGGTPNAARQQQASATQTEEKQQNQNAAASNKAHRSNTFPFPFASSHQPTTRRPLLSPHTTQLSAARRSARTRPAERRWTWTRGSPDPPVMICVC